METRFYELAKLVVQFGKLTHGKCGRFYELPILIDVSKSRDHIEIEYDLLKGINADPSWKNTFSISTMEKYEHWFTESELEEHGLDPGYKTMIISTCGNDWERLMAGYPRYVNVVVYH